jgi:hypothetical protein
LYLIFNYFIFNPVLILDGAASNKHAVTTLNTAKLDQESEELKHAAVPLEIGKLIQKGRQDKGLTQKDLATVGFICIQYN